MNTNINEQEEKASKRHLTWLVGILLALAFIGVSSRLIFFGQAHLAGGDHLWRLSVESIIQSQAQATTVNIHPPIESSRIHVIQRNMQHPGFRIRNWSDEKEERRSIRAFANAAGRYTISTEFVIHQMAVQTPPLPRTKVPLSNTQREVYLQDNDRLQLGHPRITEILKELSTQQPEREQLVEEIVNYLQLFGVSYGKDELSVPATLEKRKATTLDRALAMVALCRAAGIPARIVTGIILKDDIEPRPHYWVEAYQDKRWLAYDIQAGYRQAVPANYLPMRRNGSDIMQVLNGELLQIEYDLEREFDHPYLREITTRNYFNILDLSRLPLDARNELALLLLLPLGALITALCRHLVGLHSYGVFTPTLLALAMIYTDIMTTTVIFIVVCSLAIGGRSLFPESITRIPRLAIIFTLVALIMTLSTSVMDYFDLGQGGKVVLLPIIILTSMVDRLYRTIEDRGMKIAMRRLAWTIMITLLCLPVIQFVALGHFLVQYPELHFITLALFVLISLYKGKTLINLPFIRILAEPDTPSKKRNAKKNNASEEKQHAS